MGADFIGYILVAPMRMAGDAKKCAVEHLRAIVQQRDEFTKGFAYADVEDKVFWARLNERRFALLKGVVARAAAVEQYDDWQTMFSWLDGFLDNYKPSQFVRELRSILSDKRRSTLSRPWVHPISGEESKRYQIICTGVMSWGDGFDVESAGWYLTRAQWFDLFPILGIR